MKRVLRRINGAHFTWAGKIGTAEISDFHGRIGDHFQRVYDDAADCGFEVISSVTRNCKTFVLNGDHGSVGPFWEYEALDDPSIKIRIYND